MFDTAMPHPHATSLERASADQEPSAKRRKPRARRRFTIIALLLVVAILLGAVGVSAYGYRLVDSARGIFAQPSEPVSFFSDIGKLFGSNHDPLNGELEGRTNILLLGVPGDDWPGSQLTDSIMVVSILYPEKDLNSKEARVLLPGADKEEPRVALISIPRDLWVPAGGGTYTKINAIYTFGEQRGEGQGIISLKETLDEVLGLELHYYATADFDGFTEAIDTLGGIDVDVENSFIDYNYPTDDFGTQVVRFEAGVQHMDGETALKYARSRKGYVTDGSNADEGSDFGRARRQQQVMKAVREKALSIDTLLSPSTLQELTETAGEHISTDMEIWEAIRMADIAKAVNTDAIIQVVLDNRVEGLVYGDNVGGASVLLPVGGTWSRIQDMAQTIFLRNTEAEEEELAVAVANGTGRTGFATASARDLEGSGFTIDYIGNVATQQRPESTEILLLTDRTHAPTSIQTLELTYGVKATPTTYEQASGMLRAGEVLPSDIDVLILLGPDAIE